MKTVKGTLVEASTNIKVRDRKGRSFVYPHRTSRVINFITVITFPARPATHLSQAVKESRVAIGGFPTYRECERQVKHLIKNFGARDPEIIELPKEDAV